MDKLTNLINEKYNSLPINFLESLYSLLITDCDNVKKEKFSILFSTFKDNKDENLKIQYESIFFIVLMLDISRYFNKDLLGILKSSNKEIVVQQVLTLVFHNSTDSDEYGPFLKVKIKIFNSLADFVREYKLDFKQLQVPLIESYLDILRKIKNHSNKFTNDMIQPLIIFFKILLTWTRNILNIIDNSTQLLKSIRGEFEVLLMEREFMFYFRDIEISSSSNYFNLTSLFFPKESYSSSAEKLFIKQSSNIRKLFLYYKSAYIYLPKDYYELNNNYIANILEIKKTDNLSLIDFYITFLNSNKVYDAEVSSLINDIFLMVMKKYFANNQHSNVKDKITPNFIRLVYDRMKKEKFSLSMFDENYLNIIELLLAEVPDLKQDIETHSFTYLDEALKANEKINMSECRIFKYFKNNSKGKEILNEFLSLIIKDTNEKNFNLIFEYFKIFSEIFLQEKTFSSYENFAKYYGDFFFKYLLKLDTRFLKLLSNLLVNFEKFDRNFYGVLVFNFYNQTIKNSNRIGNEEYFNKVYCVLFQLFKPYRNHKKLIFIKNKNIVYKNNIFDKELTFEIPYSQIKTASFSNDRFLVIYLTDILIELDEPEVGFALIKNVLKFNLKNTYPESKSSIFKDLQVYFKLFFEKIQRACTKKNGLSKEYTEQVFKVLNYLFDFINDNVYDRPPEILQPVLEIYHLILLNYESEVNSKPYINNSFVGNLKDFFQQNFFNNEICLSLLSLLRNSWFFIRFYAFSILKFPQFSSYLWTIKDQLFEEISRDLLSLRQMEAEGAANVFMLMSFHYQDKFYLSFTEEIVKRRGGELFIKDLDYSTKNLTNNQNLLSQIHIIICSFVDRYIHTIEENNEKFNYNYSLHSFYIVLKSILEEEKQLIGKTPANKDQLLMFQKIILGVIKHLKTFTRFLVNNGVSEFSVDNENSGPSTGLEDFLDYENKKMISIWYTTRFGNETLNYIIEILSSRAFSPLISVLERETSFFRNLLDTTIKLMLDYHHMGVIETLNEIVLKICKLINFHEDPEISNFTYLKLEEILTKKLVKEELSTTLRRSAGLPFLITTLIKSYTFEEKFSNQIIKQILNLAITKLIENYKICQFTNSDASVHSLNILRIIVFDAVLKPYVKEFVDIILLDLLDGLKSKNWSIKNSCMLLFSNIIKNLFNTSFNEKYIPTFVEYFSGRSLLCSKISQMIAEDPKLNNNDCLILLLNFICKFKITKPQEYNREFLLTFVNLIFGLRTNGNNFVKKASVEALFTLYGGNIKAIVEKITLELENVSNEKDLTSTTNQFEFCIEFFTKLLKSKGIDLIQFLDNLNQVFNNLSKIHSRLGFLSSESLKYSVYFYHIHRTILMIAKNKFLNPHFTSKISLFTDSQDLNSAQVFDVICRDSSKPYFYKSFKNYLKLLGFQDKYNFLANFAAQIEKFLLNGFKSGQNLQLNEPITFFLSYYHKIYFDQCKNSLIKVLTNDQVLKDVNITSKLLDCLLLIKFQDNPYPLDDVMELSSKLLNFIKKNPSVTKLVRKILLLLAEIYSFPLKLKGESWKIFLSDVKLKELLGFVESVKFFSLSSNEEKLRYNSISAMNTILTTFILLDEDKRNQILVALKISEISSVLAAIVHEVILFFVLILNDEHPEIRVHGSKCFYLFNQIVKVLPPAPYYNSELVLRHFVNNVDKVDEFISKIIGTKRGGVTSKTFSYLLNYNLYYNKINSEEKVFYFEPDNRYIDNIQIKKEIYNFLSSEKRDMDLTLERSSRRLKEGSILMMLEDFTENFQEAIKDLIRKSEFSLINGRSFRKLVYPKLTQNK